MPATSYQNSIGALKASWHQPRYYLSLDLCKPYITSRTLRWSLSVNPCKVFVVASVQVYKRWANFRMLIRGYSRNIAWHHTHAHCKHDESKLVSRWISKEDIQPSGVFMHAKIRAYDAAAILLLFHRILTPLARTIAAVRLFVMEYVIRHARKGERKFGCFALCELCIIHA